MKSRIAVFASGTGSNFEAIHDAIKQHNLHADLVLLVCDKPRAAVVQKAKQRTIHTLVLNPKEFSSKQAYETVIERELQELQVDLIVLAGYMRLIGTVLLQSYPKRIINIHPSLLPKFKGLDAVGQAMNAKVKKTGVTVHYVDEGMDTGTIISQKELDITNLTTRTQIEDEIHKIEHVLYPQTIKKVLEDLQ